MSRAGARKATRNPSPGRSDPAADEHYRLEILHAGRVWRLSASEVLLAAKSSFFGLKLRED